MKLDFQESSQFGLPLAIFQSYLGSRILDMFSLFSNKFEIFVNLLFNFNVIFLDDEMGGSERERVEQRFYCPVCLPESW